MSGARLAEPAAIVALATLVTIAIAVPVLRAPSERVFGRELVGRQHDPFSVMGQFDQPVRLSVYTQPVTDLAGTVLARGVGAVAAYNGLVLFSFPLSALGAYLLARHVALSRMAATVAGLAYAFSPFHLAHAAYHPHIAQTQWLPLYVLALWRCLDRPSPVAVGLLGAATGAVTLSNFYGGFIMAVLTPVIGLAYWLVTRRDGQRPARRLGVTAVCLGVVAVAGLAYATVVAGAVVADPGAFAFTRDDLFRHSARWWSYLVPPAAHPLLGARVRDLWQAAGVREGLLEQQVTIGWGLLGLGLVAVARWWKGGPPVAAVARVPVLLAVGAAAFFCSLAPEAAVGPVTVVRPAAVLYDVVPMFRAYARFGVVVQLMAVLLAGVGLDCLRATPRRRRYAAALVLVALAAGEYAVAPSALWRDVLPTTAHRWMARQSGASRALDCAPFTLESESVYRLSAGRVATGSAMSDCTEPNLAETLAAAGYTHLVVRRTTADGAWFAARPAPLGLRLAADFDDGQVFAVTAHAPGVVAAAMTGFSPREHNAERSWRWMSRDAEWTIVNTTSQPIVTTLGLELWTFHRARPLEVRLNQRRVQTLTVEPARRTYTIGPLTLSPGGHGLVFHSIEPPPVAGDVLGNGDPRALSFAFGAWAWHVQEGLR